MSRCPDSIEGANGQRAARQNKRTGGCWQWCPVSEVVGLLDRAGGKDDGDATWRAFDRDRLGVVQQQIIPYGLEDRRNPIGLHG